MKIKGFIIFQFFILILFGCRKVDVDKSREKLHGQWELEKYEFNGSDAMNSFKSDEFYANKVIFYPFPDTNLYINTSSTYYSKGKWVLSPIPFSPIINNKAKLHLQFVPYFTRSIPLNYSGNFGLYRQWMVTKLNNNILILELEENIQYTINHYKMTFIKTGKF